MALSTLGSGDTAARVAATIQRRGAGGSPLTMLWTSLAGAGVVLAIIAMFVPWYSAARSLTALFSGWTPMIALGLIIAGGLVLMGAQFDLFGRGRRVSADLFTYAALGAGAAVLVLRQLVTSEMSNAVYVLLIPIALFVVAILRSLRNKAAGAMLELEQVALGLSSIGGALVIVKRLLDAENATSGWVWGLIAAVAVVSASLAACQYLGLLTVFQVMLFTALALSTVLLIVVLAQVIGDGWPVLSTRFGDFWSGTLRSRSSDEALGISQGLLGSFWIAVFVVVLAFPIGIAAAVYLEEYAPRNWFTNMLDIVVRNLAGVPSVVYGLLGLFLFVRGTVVTHWFIRQINSFWTLFYEDELIEIGQSTLFAGGVTIAILVLPIVIITAAEAVRAVPQSLREGAYGVGATKWEVIRSQVLPFAAPGILTGTLLSLSRAVGEAAPLLIIGAVTGRLGGGDSMFESFESFVGQFADRFAAMPIVIVDWVLQSGRDDGFAPAAGAAIVVLLAFVIAMNSVAVFLRNYFEKKRA